MAEKDKAGSDEAIKLFGSLLDIEDGTAKTVEPVEAGKEVSDLPEGDKPTEVPEDVVDEPADDVDTPALVPVKDEETGNVIEVEEEEAHNGYLRLQDYTRKRQADAQLRREAEALKAEASQKLEAYEQKLNQITDAMDTMVPKEPDWATLSRTKSPAEYGQIRAEWDQFSAARKVIEDQKKEVAAVKQREAEAKDKESYAAEEQKLLAAKPEWQDPAKFSKAKTELVTYLQGKGYTPEEISTVRDHRLVIALSNAMEYEKAKSGTPAPRAAARKPGKTLAPGTDGSSLGKPKTPQDDRSKAFARAEKTGKVDDAARYFERLL